MSDEKKKPGPQKAKLFAKFKAEALKDEAAKKGTPLLLDVLLPIYQDGVLVRQPGRLSIQADGTAWRITIECPTEQVQTVMGVETLSTLLVDVESLLGSGKLHWGDSWQKRKKNLPVVDGAV